MRTAVGAPFGSSPRLPFFVSIPQVVERAFLAISCASTMAQEIVPVTDGGHENVRTREEKTRPYGVPEYARYGPYRIATVSTILTAVEVAR